MRLKQVCSVCGWHLWPSKFGDGGYCPNTACEEWCKPIPLTLLVNKENLNMYVPDKECTQTLYCILDEFKNDIEQNEWESHEDFLSQLCKFLLDVDELYYAECIKFNNKKGNEDETT